VETEINLIPRSQVAATNPTRSVVAPPPTPIIRSERVNLADPNLSQHFSKTLLVLAFSASGIEISITFCPDFLTILLTFLAIAETFAG